MAGDLYITGDPDADRLLNRDGLALMIGMLLDQQVPMEWAFTGPATIRTRLGHLDAKRIAAMSEDELRHLLQEQFRAYRSTLQGDRRHLLEQFQVIDVARKVVGVGSVGRRNGSATPSAA